VSGGETKAVDVATGTTAARIHIPKPGAWTAEWLALGWTPPAGHEPTWLARVLTRWLLGVTWRRNA
jgi:hypothetical protein